MAMVSGLGLPVVIVSKGRLLFLGVNTNMAAPMVNTKNTPTEIATKSNFFFSIFIPCCLPGRKESRRSVFPVYPCENAP